MRKCDFFIIAMVLGLNGCSGDMTETQENISPGVFSSVSQSIINGKVDYSGNWSNVAAIILRDHPNYPWQVACSGTLITPRHILTAAHCVADLSSKYLLYSEDSVDSECRWSGGFISTGAADIVPYLKVGVSDMLRFFKNSKLYDVQKIIYHSGFSTVSTSVGCINNNYSGYEVTQNDIALLELSEAVPSDVATPMPILPPWIGITEDQVRDGLEMELVGFGYDEHGEKGIRRRSVVPLEMYCPDNNVKFCPYDKTIHVKGCHPDKETCNANGKLNYYDDMVAIPSKGLFYLQSKGGACNGDSGGPAILKVGGRKYVAGVTSYGDSACSTYGISTAVQDFYDWIVKNAPEAAEQIYEVCGNGLDDDNNGFFDSTDDVCDGVPYCGDRKVNQTSETCDNLEYRDGLQLCSDWSAAYSDGKVFCNEDCSLDFSMCVEKEAPDTCANGQLDEGEQCDGSLFKDIYGTPINSLQCADFSAYFVNGELACNNNCTVNLDACILTDFLEDEEICGDGVLQSGELCDGNVFMGGMSAKCSDWDSRYIGGDVECFNCKPDFENCIRRSVCGDGKRTEMEVCEGDDFYSGKSCDNWSMQMAWGEVSCNSNCTVDYSKCVMTQEAKALCGNGALDAHYYDDGDFMFGEECDGELFVNGNDCFDWDSRFVSGKVTCMDNCMVNLEKCKYAMDVIYLDENARGKLYVLNRLPKPEVLAPKKPNDSIVIFPNGNLYEDLDDIYLQNPRSAANEPDSGSQEPPVHSENDKPENVPQAAEEPANDDGGCSAVVSRHTSNFQYLAFVCLAMGAGFVLKRRKKYQ